MTLANCCTSPTQDRLLVIDDNPAIHEDFRKILAGEETAEALNDAEAAFFGVTAEKPTGEKAPLLDSAFQGEEGYAKVLAALRESAPYGLVFCDMRMPPGWDGLKTIENLRKIDPALPVVICTAYTDYTWDDILERLGRPDNLLLLKKPFDHSEVQRLASDLSDRRRQSTSREDSATQCLLLDEKFCILSGSTTSPEYLGSRLDDYPRLVTAQTEIQSLCHSPLPAVLSIPAAHTTDGVPLQLFLMKLPESDSAAYVCTLATADNKVTSPDRHSRNA